MAATGVHATRLLSVLCAPGVETHLVMSKWALTALKYETMLSEADLRPCARQLDGQGSVDPHRLGQCRSRHISSNGRFHARP